MFRLPLWWCKYENINQSTRVQSHEAKLAWYFNGLDIGNKMCIWAQDLPKKQNKTSSLQSQQKLDCMWKKVHTQPYMYQLKAKQYLFPLLWVKTGLCPKSLRYFPKRCFVFWRNRGTGCSEYIKDLLTHCRTVNCAEDHRIGSSECLSWYSFTPENSFHTIYKKQYERNLYGLTKQTWITHCGGFPTWMMSSGMSVVNVESMLRFSSVQADILEPEESQAQSHETRLPPPVDWIVHSHFLPSVFKMLPYIQESWQWT